MRQDKLGAIAGAQLIFYGNKKLKRFVKRELSLITKIIILVILGGTGIGMDKTRYFERLDLITQIQEEGKKLLSGGHNYIFTMESNVDEVTGRDTTMYAIASAIQKEAKKIVAMGYNAKISCDDGRHV